MFDPHNNARDEAAEGGDATAGADATAPGRARVGTASRTRYRDAAMSWLALGALLAAWHMEARLDRPEDSATDPRLATVRNGGVKATGRLWLNRATEAPTWIARAPHGVARENRQAFDGRRPEWQRLASVRTLRRWLDAQ